MHFDLNEWLDYSERVAKKFAQTYWPVANSGGEGLSERWEDIYQELAIELITFEQKLKESPFKTRRFEQMTNASGYIKTALKNRAWRYCSREKGKERTETDFYEYQTADVRIMVEQYLAGTKRKILVPEDAQSVFGEDDLAILCDVGRVVDELSEQDYNILEEYLLTPENKEPAERQRFSRVIRKVTQTLNRHKKNARRDYEGTGSRKVLTNSASRGTSKDDYNFKERDLA